jgi:RNA polymerase sigma factor (TIGR02999 family)
MRPKRRTFCSQNAALLLGKGVVKEITVILPEMGDGDRQAADLLLPAVYEEMRRLATARMAHEPAGLTLQPTALVHEAWLRLGADAQPNWRSRAHFFGAAAEAMRRILIERARRRRALRHGGGQERVDIDAVEVASPAGESDEQILAINDALEKFATAEPQKAELVKLRYFVGMKNDEVAEALGISEPTAKRWWAYARAWLFREMRPSEEKTPVE